MDKSRVGERGTSVLGALVLALMLGTGAVVTFELAGPLPASVSQTGASGVLAVEKKAPTKLRAEKCTNVYACNQVAVANSKEVLSQPCTPGFDYVVDEKKGKIEVKATAQNPGACPKSATEVPSEAELRNDKVVTKEVADAKLKLNKCSDKNLVRGYIPKGTTGSCTYKYCGSIDLKEVRQGGKTVPAESMDLDCATGEGDGKTLGDIRSAARSEKLPDLIAGLSDADKARLDQSGLTGLEQRAAGRINDSLMASEQSVAESIAKTMRERRDIEASLKACETAAGCPTGTTKDDLKTEREKLIAKEMDLRRDMSRLSALEATPLADIAAKGPPGKEEVITCVGTTCKDSTGKVVPPPGSGGGGGGGGGGSNETFGKPGGGGGDLSQLLKGLTGQNQPPPGNGVPQPAGTCSPSMICGNNTIYSRNNQCVDQAMQQCQYGCSGTQCSQPPPQGTGCLTAPSQPDPSGCQNGTYKPTYGGTNNACVVGWQCVPGTGGGGTAPTAQLSCQPKVADVGMEALITFSCSAGTSSGSGFNTNGAQSGSATTTLSAPPGNTNTANFGLTCTNAGLTGSAQCSIQVGKPGIVLVANPKTVVSGKTSALGWVTSGMQKCIISSPNLSDFTSQNADKTSVNGTATTPPLTATNSATTTYNFLLSCVTLGGGTRQASTTVSATP